MPTTEQSTIPNSFRGVEAETTAAERTRRRHWRRPVVVLAAIAVASAVVVTAIILTREASSDGEAVSEMVMEAWATGEQTDIGAIYAEEVRMVLDGDILTETREQITEAITGAIRFGNTYQQVGPVSEYVAADGDLYVATLVEVVGAGHPAGDPVVGFYRVRDGKVIRHVFIDAEHY